MGLDPLGLERGFTLAEAGRRVYLGPGGPHGVEAGLGAVIEITEGACNLIDGGIGGPPFLDDPGDSISLGAEDERHTLRDMFRQPLLHRIVERVEHPAVGLGLRIAGLGLGLAAQVGQGVQHLAHHHVGFCWGGAWRVVIAAEDLVDDRHAIISLC